MSLLTVDQQRQVSSAIAAVEDHTDAELVVVLARRADSYQYIPTLWAAVIALVTPAVVSFTPFWLSPWEMLLSQWVVFVVLALILRIPPIMVRLIPKSVRYWRAANLARRQFMENNLHHTDGDTGVLIFVAEAEHYVEILADRGISQHISDDRWKAIVNAFAAKVRAGRTLEGFLECIEASGTLLKQYAPATHDRNELPDRLIILE
ncbi:MAG: TPM domain-containing protein [Gammaproteobacteria bacterium]|jgi:putative membrane protein